MKAKVIDIPGESTPTVDYRPTNPEPESPATPGPCYVCGYPAMYRYVYNRWSIKLHQRCVDNRSENR